MADYAISNVVRRVVYTNTGVGPYAFTFEVLANTDIAVYRGSTLLTLTTDYTVIINANGTGSVTLVTAGTGNITIVGARAIQRTSDYTTGGDLFASTLNTDLDSQTIYAQQVAETAERGLKAPVIDPTDINMTLPAKATRAGTVLAFNATTGNPEAGPSIASVTTVAAQSANINTVATNIASVNTVASNVANVNTVAGVSGNVTTVASNITNVNAVGADLLEAVSEINTVATDIANVNTVGTNIANVNTVAGISANVTTVAGISGNVTTVAGNNANVSTVAGISGNVTTVAGISANVTTVAGISSDVSTVSTNNANVTTVATNIASVNTNATNIVAIQNASTNATNAANSATAAAASAASAAASFDAFDDIYLGAKASNPTVDNDGDALTTGDQYFNTVSNELRVWNGSSWQAASVIGGTVTTLGVTGVATFSAGTVSLPAITTTGDTNTGIFFPAADTIAFTEGGTESMRITSTGNLGLGTTNPSADYFTQARLLQITGSNSAAIKFERTDATARKWEIGLTSGGNFDITDTVASTSEPRFRIDTSGNVGIGTSSPSYKLHVNGGVLVKNDSGFVWVDNAAGTGFPYINPIGYFVDGGYQARIYGTGVGNGQSMLFSTAATERMRIDSSGNVGIGTSSPSYKLQVSGTGTVSSRTIATDAGGDASFFVQNNAGSLAGPLVYGSTKAAYGALGSGETAFYSNAACTILSENVLKFAAGGNTERMRIDTSGFVLVGKTSATANGGDLQVSSGITFPATQVAKSDANTLDDYEEGTWTPVLAGSTTAGTYVYDTDRTGGQYTKIGRLVTIRGAFRVSSVTSAGTGDATITGVPFVAANVATAWTRTPGSLIQQSGATLATNSLFVGFATTGSAVLTMSTQSTSTIAAISVTDADFVDSIYSFTFTYFV